MPSVSVSWRYFVVSDNVEDQVCPVIVQLAQPGSTDDFRTEAAAVGILLTLFYLI